MALKVIEGFDYYDNVGQIVTRSGYLQWVAASPLYCQLTAGRIDGTGKAIQLNLSTQPLVASLATNNGTGYIGYAVRLDNNGQAPSHTLTFHETNANVDQCAITLNGGDASITTPFGRTTNNLFPLSTWFYLEIGVTISKTVGRIIIRINGVTVANVTGNTAPGTVNEWFNGFSIAPGLYSTTGIDDIYLCDNTVGPGAFPMNGFLGDRRIFTLVPSGAGAHTTWTPLAGSNFSQVAVGGDDASYNSSSTAGAEDSFILNALPSTVTAVLAVQVTGRYKKVDATAHTLTQRLISGGVDAPGVGFLAPYALSTTYVYYSDLFVLDPGTGASWNVTALAAGVVQIGYKLET